MVVDAPEPDGPDGGIEGEPDRPAPNGVVTAAEYVAAMRRLKNWSGMSYRQLEKRAASGGDVLPRTTLTSALTHDRLPQEHLVAAFARACGCDEDEVQHWVRTRRRIAAIDPATAPAPSSEAGDLGDLGDAEEGAIPPGPQYGGGIRGAIRRRPVRFLAGAAALVVALAAGVALGAMSVEDGPAKIEQPEPESSPSVGPDRSAPAGTPSPTVASDVSSPFPTMPPPTEPQMRWPTRAPEGAPKVLYVGDSIATETHGTVAYYLHRTRKAALVPVTHPDAALCDYLAGAAGRSSVPDQHKLPNLVAQTKPRVVALQFWGRSSKRTPCTGAARPGSETYYQRYLADARLAVQQITQAAQAAGIPRPKLVWVLQGPDKKLPDRIRRLNEGVYQAVAAPYGDLLSDAGYEVSMDASPMVAKPNDRYTWTRYLPCNELERRYHYCSNPVYFGGVSQFHAEFDDVHLCLTITAGHRCGIRSPGVIRYGTAIVRTVIQALS